MKLFGCGKLNKRSNQSLVDYIVYNFSDIKNKIIPFFEKSQLQGNKRLNFIGFCKIADLMAKKAHLTQEGLDQIINIKAGMNTKRAKNG
jgi:hypothetical protein